MHKTTIIADIIIVIIGTLIAVFILIFPFFFSVRGAVFVKEKAAKITIAVFGIVVYKRKTKIRLSSLVKSFGGKNPFTTVPKISVLSVNAIINTGIEDDIFLPIMTISAFTTAKNTRK